MPYNYVAPANAILVNGVPLRHEWRAAHGSAILPGDQVEFDLTYCTGGDVRIHESPANSEVVLGVADLEPWHPRTTVYDEGDAVRVLSGHVVMALRLAANESIDCGDNLKSAASGEVQYLNCEAGTTDPDMNACLLVGQALFSYPLLTTMQWIVAKYYK